MLLRFSYRYGLLASLCWLALAVPPAPATAQQLDMVRLTREPNIELRFFVENDFLVLPVKMNDRRQLRFIVDTGAENSVLLDKSIGDELRVDYRRRFMIRGSDVDNELVAYLATGIDLEFSDILLARNRSMLVLKENYFQFEHITGTPVHGILGADFLSRFVVEIDYERRRIVLRDPRRFRPGRRFVRAPATFIRARPYLELPVDLLGRQPERRRLLLDSGAGLPLLLHTGPGSRTADLPERVISTHIANGLGGRVEGAVGRTKELRLGGKSLTDVITFFQPLDTVDLDFMNGRDGIVGNRVLNRFRVIIDYPRERLYLRPDRRRWKQRFNYDRSGLNLTAGGRGFNHIIVGNVLPDSPAAERGIQIGDRIRAVNGTPAIFLSIGGIIRKLEGKVGKKVRIRVERAGRLYEMDLVLRDLI